VVCVTTPGKAGAERYYRLPLGSSTLWTCLECLAGGAAAAVVFVIWLPVLTDLTRTFELLSTTMLVFVFLFLWLSLWAVIGSVHEQVWTTG